MSKSPAVAAVLALMAGTAGADFCSRDVVPAATILVPYAVVSMDGTTPDPDGMTTVLRLTNTAPEATVVNVTIWDATGHGVLDFCQALSGYDTWSINFRDLLSGHWSGFDTSLSASAYPNTETTTLKRSPFEWGPDGRSAYGGPAPQTTPWPRALPTPQPTSALPPSSCYMPYGDAAGAIYGPFVVSMLQGPLLARQHGGCGGGTQWVVRHTSDWLSTLDDQQLFFFATVDVTNRCDTAFPSDPGYFTGFASNRNVLIGDVLYLGAAGATLETTPATHVEASDSRGPAVRGPYESLLGLTGDDAREPLPTAFGFHYSNDPPNATSSLMVWKTAPELESDLDVVDCGAYLYYAWDEDEHVFSRGQQCPVAPCDNPDIDPNELPFVTQLVPLSTAGWDLPDRHGWMLLVLPPSYDTPFSDHTVESDGLLDFPYMGVAATRTSWGSGSGWHDAAVMASAHCHGNQVLPDLGRAPATALPTPGDANGDSTVSVADVFYVINFLFAGGPAPLP